MQPIILKDLPNAGEYEGLVYIQSHGKKLDPTSRAPVNGTLMHKGKTMNFKTWDTILQRHFNENDLAGQIFFVTGSTGVYNNNNEFTITSLKPVEGVSPSLFFKSVDVDSVWNEFVSFLQLNLEAGYMQTIVNIFNAEGITERFKLEWAGSRMHDAQVGGLMIHTLKLLKLAKTCVDSDPRLEKYKNLLYFNIIMHDIGKVYELQDGRYLPNSFVTHRTLGVEISVRHKQSIVDAHGEEFFYHILAVQQGHHGDFGDPPTTVWALIIHLIDMVDSKITGLLDSLEAGDAKEKNGQSTVWISGKTLVV